MFSETKRGIAFILILVLLITLPLGIAMPVTYASDNSGSLKNETAGNISIFANTPSENIIDVGSITNRYIAINKNGNTLVARAGTSVADAQITSNIIATAINGEIIIQGTTAVVATNIVVYEDSKLIFTNLSLTSTTPVRINNADIDVEIGLVGENTVKAASGNNAGINVGDSAHLTISGPGSLTVGAGANGTGIGGANLTGYTSGYQNGGTITIENCSINATGGSTRGAGIGSYFGAYAFSNLTVNNSSVTATAKGSAAGIGGSSGGANNLTFNSSTITASAVNEAAGIGAGNNGPVDGITFNGCNIYTTSSNRGAGIGSGYTSSSSSNGGSAQNITINGGTVYAKGGLGSAGIGGANWSVGRNIKIINASVQAISGGCGAAGIGSGNVCTGTTENIEITGSSFVIANHGSSSTNTESGGAGIGGGGGAGQTMGNVSGIYIGGDSIVYAYGMSRSGTSVTGGSGIGSGGVTSGKAGSVSNIRITGNAKVSATGGEGGNNAGGGAGIGGGGASSGTVGDVTDISIHPKGVCAVGNAGSGTGGYGAAIGSGGKNGNTNGANTARMKRIVYDGNGQDGVPALTILQYVKNAEIADGEWLSHFNESFTDFDDSGLMWSISPTASQGLEAYSSGQEFRGADANTVLYAVQEQRLGMSLTPAVTNNLIGDVVTIKAVTNPGSYGINNATWSITSGADICQIVSQTGNTITIKRTGEGTINVQAKSTNPSGYTANAVIETVYNRSDGYYLDVGSLSQNYIAIMREGSDLVARAGTSAADAKTSRNIIATSSNKSLIIKGTSTANAAVNVIVYNDSNIIFDNLTLNSTMPIRIDDNDIKVDIELLGENVITASSGNNAGISNGDNAHLRLYGSGSLTVQAGANGSGIGGAGVSGYYNGGTITIDNTTITAIGGTRGSGIGSYAANSSTYSLSDLTINNSAVTAIGKGSAAGIGGSGGGANNLIFNNSTITASAVNEAAGIGAGNNGPVDGITFNDCNVYTTSSNRGAGIGSGYTASSNSTNGYAQNILINGGSVYAKGGYGAAGIGGANMSTGKNIKIMDANVHAISGASGAAGIGSGNACTGATENIEITGSSFVIADHDPDTSNAESGGAGIGGGGGTNHTLGNVSGIYVGGDSIVYAYGKSGSGTLLSGGPGLGAGSASSGKAGSVSDIRITGNAKVTAIGGAGGSTMAGGAGIGGGSAGGGTVGTLSDFTINPKGVVAVGNEGADTGGKGANIGSGAKTNANGSNVSGYKDVEYDANGYKGITSKITLNYVNDIEIPSMKWLSHFDPTFSSDKEPVWITSNTGAPDSESYLNGATNYDPTSTPSILYAEDYSLKSILITPSSSAVNLDDVVTLTSMALPSVASNEVEWSVDGDEDLYTKLSESTTELAIKADDFGTITVIAIAEEDNSVSASAVIVVEKYPPNSVVINPTSTSVELGNNVAIVKEELPYDKKDDIYWEIISGSENISVTSSNSAIATVSGIATGQGIIRAISESNPNASATAIINVLPSAPKNLTISGIPGTVYYGQSFGVTADSDNIKKESLAVDWTVTTVTSGSGTLSSISVYNPTFTAIHTGKVKLTATSNHYPNISASAIFDITKAIPDVTKWPTGGSITYGAFLSDSKLDKTSAGAVSYGKDVPGTFDWEDGTTKPAVGTKSFEMIFTPTDLINYTTVGAMVSVIIEKATPVITTDPAVTEIFYGQILSSSAITPGAATYDGKVVPGEFTWESPTTVPAIGTNTYRILFTPTDKDSYNTTTKAISVTVNKATPVWDKVPSATAITYGATLSKSDLSGWSVKSYGKDVVGTVSWTSGSAIPNVSSTKKYEVIFKPSDAALHESITTKIAIKVNPVAPEQNGQITATAITYGAFLSESAIKGSMKGISGEAVGGTFEWKNKSDVPGAAETVTAKAVFTPTGTNKNNYEKCEVDVTLTVNKAVPVVSDHAIAADIQYTQKLLESQPKGGAVVYKEKTVSGSWIWVSGDTEPPVGTSSYSAIFTPSGTDANNYTSISALAYITVTSPELTVDITPSAVSITYGSILSDSAIEGGSVKFGSSTIGGIWAWKDKNHKPDSGQTSHMAIFTPGNSNYPTIGAIVDLTVNKALASNITAPSISGTAVYGDTLKDVPLTGGSVKSGNYTLTGNWEWTTSTTAVKIGKHSYEATYNLSEVDGKNYIAPTVQVEFTTLPFTPKLKTTPGPIELYYGEELGAFDLSKLDNWKVSGVEDDIDGDWIWKDDNITASAVGTMSAIAIFKPLDDYEGNYTTLSALLDIKVKSPELNVDKSPSTTAITYGGILSDSAITGGSVKYSSEAIPGKWTWENKSYKPDAGYTSYMAIFKPGNTNYSTIGAFVYLTVNKAVATDITAPAISGTAVYGDVLKDISLTGGSVKSGNDTLNGKWEWTTSSAAARTGEHSYDAVFKLSGKDADNYVEPKAQVKFTTLKYTPQLKVTPGPIELVYGDVISDFDLSELDDWEVSGVDENLPGEWDWKDPLITASSVGVVTSGAIFTPDETENYTSITAILDINVTKASLTVSVAAIAANITYGSILSDSAISGYSFTGVDGKVIPGNMEWVNKSHKPDEGTTSYAVKFTPSGNNIDIYNVYESTLPVKVAPGIPEVEESPTVKAITYGQKLSDSAITGGIVTYDGIKVDGSWKWADETIEPPVSNTSYEAIFTPTGDKAHNYTTISAFIYVKVTSPELFVDEAPSATSITYGAVLSDSAITGGSVKFGTTDLPGKWTWENPACKPDAGYTSYMAIFKPNNTNYSTIGAFVYLTVNKAVATDITAPVISGTAVYGDVLSDIVLTGGSIKAGSDNLNGSWKWKTSSEAVKTGEHSYDAVFKLSSKDADNYIEPTAKITFTTVKYPPKMIVTPGPIELSYGEETGTFDLSNLNNWKVAGADEDLSGEWKWADDEITASAVGTMSALAIFTPSNTDDYTSISALLSINVSKAEIPTTSDGSISSGAVATDITYGSIMSDSKITGYAFTGVFGEATPGKVEWKNKTDKPDAGTASYAAVFIPNEDYADLYDEYEFMLKLTVTPGIPTIEEDPEAEQIVYGSKLSDSAITDKLVTYDGIKVNGSWSWADKTIEPSVGTTSYKAIFTPTGTKAHNYTTISAMVYIKVVEPTLEVDSLPTAANITYGALLITSALTGGSVTDGSGQNVLGNWAWKNGNTIKPDAGTASYEAIFTPKDSNLSKITKEIKLTVHKEIPTLIKAPTTLSIVEGDSLRLASFKDDGVVSGAGAEVTGKWSWADNTIVPDKPGTTSYEAIFTPSGSDEKNFTTISSFVDVIVGIFDADLLVKDRPLGDGYNYNGQTLHIDDSGEYTIYLAEGRDTSYRANIEVASSVNAVINLSGVAIDVSTFEDKAALATGAFSKVKVNLIGDNTLISGSGRAGLEINSITVPLSLTIGGAGSLYAKGGTGGAGIGSAVDNAFTGITINDLPAVTAIGGDATDSYGAGAGIGSGGGSRYQQGAGNIITHELGVDAVGGKAFEEEGNILYGAGADIGTGGVPEDDGNNVAGIKKFTYNNNKSGNDELEVALSYTKNVRLPGMSYLKNFEPEFDADVQGLNWSFDREALSEIAYPAGYYYNTTRSGKFYAVDEAVEDLQVIYATNYDGYVHAGKYLNITEDGTYYIAMKRGMTITTKGVIRIAENVEADIQLVNINIDVGERNSLAAFDVSSGADVNIILSGTNSLTSGTNRAGINVAHDAKLNIAHVLTGSLTVKGGAYGAGIGGSIGQDAGSINIEDEITIKAYGGTNAPGIGGGGNVNDEPVGNASQISIGVMGVHSTGGDSANVSTVSIGSGANDEESASSLSGSAVIKYIDITGEAVDLSYIKMMKVPDGNWLRTYNSDFKAASKLCWSEDENGASGRVYQVGSEVEELDDTTLYALSAPDGLMISPASIEIDVDEVITLCALAESEGSVQGVNWSIENNDDDLVHVTYSGILATVTALKPGSVNVNAASLADEDITAESTVTVSKIPPQIATAPSINAITYGSMLSEAKLTGASVIYDGDIIEGGWNWEAPDTKPPANEGTDDTSYTAIFTPDDPLFGPIKVDIPVRVNKYIPQVTFEPNASIIYEDDKLEDSKLTDGFVMGAEEQIYGSFEWVDPHITPSKGKSLQVYKFTPDEEYISNYSIITGKALVFVPKFYKDIQVIEAYDDQGIEFEIEEDWYESNHSDTGLGLDEVLVIKQSGRYSLALDPKANGESKVGSIVIAENVDADISFNNISIDLAGINPQLYDYRSPVKVQENASLNLTLSGQNALIASPGKAGISVHEDGEIDILEPGGLTVIGGNATENEGAGAGIGSNGSDISAMPLGDIKISQSYGISASGGAALEDDYGEGAAIGEGSFSAEDGASLDDLLTIKYNDNNVDNEFEELIHGEKIKLPNENYLRIYNTGFDSGLVNTSWSKDSKGLTEFVYSSNRDLTDEDVADIFGSADRTEMFAVERTDHNLIVTESDNDSASAYYYQGQMLIINESGEYTIEMKDGITMTTHATIKVNENVEAKIKLEGVYINASDRVKTTAFDISDDSNIELTVSGDVKLVSGTSRSGIELAETASLKVEYDGDGSLKAIGGAYGAGIGSSEGRPSGTVTELPAVGIVALGGTGGIGIGSAGNGYDIDAIPMDGYMKVTYDQNNENDNEDVTLAYMNKAELPGINYLKKYNDNIGKTGNSIYWSEDDTGLEDIVYSVGAELDGFISKTMYALDGPDEFTLEPEISYLMVDDEVIISAAGFETGIIGGMDWSIEGLEGILDIEGTNGSATVTAIGAGMATVKAQSKVDGTKTAYATIIAEKKPPETVTIDPNPAYTEVDKQVELTAEVENIDNERVDFEWSIIEGSDKVNIIEKTSSKLILEGKSLGNVTVSAVSRSAPNVSDTAIVQVLPEPPDDLKITGIDIHDLIFEDMKEVTAQTEGLSGCNVSWKVVNGDSVKLTKNGDTKATIEAVSAGNARIMAYITQYPNISMTVEVTVKKAQADLIDVPTTAAINYGTLLSDCKLVGGKVEYKGIEIEGTWTWANSNEKPSGGNQYRYHDAIFTPENKNLEEITSKVAIFVEGDIDATIPVLEQNIVIQAVDVGKEDIIVDVFLGTYAVQKLVQDMGTDDEKNLVFGLDYGIVELGGNTQQYVLSKEYIKTLPVGTHTITFVTDGKVDPLMTITILADDSGPTAVTLDKVTAKLNIGATLKLNAAVSPGDAKDKSVTWSSSNNSVATVMNGTVTGKTEGTVVITAKTINGLIATCTVTVVQNVTKLRAPMTKYNITRKKSITVPVVCDDGSKVVISKLTATSNKPKIATVTVSGNNIKIKANKKKTGTAKITVKSANGKSVTLTVKVVNKAVKINGVKVKGLKTKYKKGKTTQIKVTPKSAKSTNLKVTYKTNKKKIATVDKAGKVTFKKKGKVTITIKVGKKSVKKKITVK